MPYVDEEEILIARRALGRAGFKKLLEYSDPRISPSIVWLGDFFKALPEPRESLEERVKVLEDEVRRLRKEHKPSTKRPTKADLVYEMFRGDLEKEHFGKIVAMDVDSETIVGIGNTVREAYNEARKKSSKTKFSFKRVGYPYVYRL